MSTASVAEFLRMRIDLPVMDASDKEGQKIYVR